MVSSVFNPRINHQIHQENPPHPMDSNVFFLPTTEPMMWPPVKLQALRSCAKASARGGQEQSVMPAPFFVSVFLSVVGGLLVWFIPDCSCDGSPLKMANLIGSSKMEV